MAGVKVILREDVANLGVAGDVVTVKPGFARNFLLREGRAAVASDGQVQQLEHQRQIIADKLVREMKDLQGLRDRLQALRLRVEVKAGEEGKLFGSVTAQQIADLIGEKGIPVDRRKVALDEPIKDLGEYQVTIKLRRELTASVAVEVVRAE